MMKKITNVKTIIEMKKHHEQIAMLTAYDYLTAKILDRCGIDIILVGDSAAMVFAGEENTLSITLDEMIYHAKAVMRARQTSLVVFDMPFGSYQVSLEETKKNIIRVIKETGCDAIKLEGGREIIPLIKEVIGIGIPVMGHIGLKPQRVKEFGKYRKFGVSEQEKRLITKDAIELYKAGVFAIVLELVEENLAKEITQKIDVPTIGIGSGAYCDGQVLVISDMLGMDKDTHLRHVKQYADLDSIISNATKQFIQDVKSNNYKV